MAKYVFVTGGVVSAIGKGITMASLGRLLKDRGYCVGLIKMDPYINVDAGLMNPFQHGEVFVTDDGSETDLDLGHYERFVDEPLCQLSNLTTGLIYGNVINKERNGNYYLGQTVQVIPHITNEIKDNIRAYGQDKDICLVEVGGTVGDIEGLPFLEAIRQMRREEGDENVCYIHVTLIPYLGIVGELKTKPTQHSVQELRRVGISPDILVARTSHPLDMQLRKKLALFCDLSVENIVECIDIPGSLYEIPMAVERQGIADLISDNLHLKRRKLNMTEWQDMLDRLNNPQGKVRIAMVGKYMDLHDAYLSVTEAVKHGGIQNQVEIEIKYVDSEDVTDETVDDLLGDVDGVLVPGGFGNRGIEGKIRAAQYARENKVPYMGLCLGLQIAVIEFARNVCGLTDANSKEFNEETPHPVVIYLKEQEYITRLGGTMRLGAYPCKLKEGSLAHRLYGVPEIAERHRHRLEVSNAYRDQLAEKGLVFGGTSPEGDLVEMIELPGHPFYLASQFHPEFKSRPNRAHPMFAGFIKAAWDHAKADSRVPESGQKSG
ncbi:MAG: CTP synthase [Armatimonadia bacterium]